MAPLMLKEVIPALVQGISIISSLICHGLNSFLLIFAGYFLVNLLFGTVYYMIGVENLRNAVDKSPMQSYLNAYFFSVQTFTTVGYGGLVPSGFPANFVASIEAMVGLLGFAIATGLLYGRFSRPSARILFSRNAIVAPYLDKTALMFRLTNQRNNDIIEVEANVLAVFIDKSTNNRKYYGMKLERNSVYFFPLSWWLFILSMNKAPSIIKPSMS